MPLARGNYEEPFSAERGITQGGLLSSLMFNLCVNAMVREWLHQTLGEEVARDGLGACMVQILVAFYINDGLIASRDPVWLQEPFDVLIRLVHKCSQDKFDGLHPRTNRRGLHRGRVRQIQISD
jgi:hypothetical protein